MDALAVVALIGRMVAGFSLLMAVPMVYAIYAGELVADDFLKATATTLAIGGLASLMTRRFRRELQPRDGFLLVGLTWAVLPTFGALPLYLALPGLSPTDAYFEAVSALTATGATVLSGLDTMPASVHVWRCLMMWVGGLGIIVLAVAILPMLGVGGSQLFRAEITGPMKDSKLTPRIADTARAIWGVYVLLSLACALAYRAAGMSWLDAFVHMGSTVSLGGFSSYDASFGHWNSPDIEAVAIFFMLLSGVNLTLYYVVWRERSPAPLWRNAEARAFYLVLAASIALIAVYLWATGAYDSLGAAFRHSAFHVVSIATTTGYAAYDYASWPLFASLLMILLGCFATCAGSTGGGIKMVRLILLLKQARHEFVRIVHPNVVNPVVLNGRAVSDRVMNNVVGYMMTYGAVLVGLTMAMLFTGLDAVTAFTAIVACVNNIGPGLGEVGPAVNYGGLSDVQTWICAFAMLVGRLELLAVLVLFMPAFWRD
ncbi:MULTISPECIES: TrkH family potassium uptake protein [Rubrivivax]|uniref:Trk system potassium uptake protein n=1 Tax=Rubrivivax benzoatilyticus TaxID=316997 RepID=A0ABX0HSW8_9BURK|nr:MULTISPECIES: potassium transporter TrkG [Rubrivivax]EGJ09266.1 cation transporter [Rubrivivax benzoatilyticus JA2 = ATCC BAA-35]NHK97728.1 TrkH family potassium uptake protein [Rubrivivax benzoatilyticus]NHL23230.1 TrkH family potassium uptake protein [Rubrivivax benzoatilyticus]